MARKGLQYTVIRENLPLAKLQARAGICAISGLGLNDEPRQIGVCAAKLHPCGFCAWRFALRAPAQLVQSIDNTK
eukprot:1869401-Pleurochrysis_carterae.AAC.1